MSTTNGTASPADDNQFYGLVRQADGLVNATNRIAHNIEKMLAAAGDTIARLEARREFITLRAATMHEEIDATLTDDIKFIDATISEAKARIGFLTGNSPETTV